MFYKMPYTLIRLFEQYVACPCAGKPDCNKWLWKPKHHMPMCKACNDFYEDWAMQVEAEEQDRWEAQQMAWVIEQEQEDLKYEGVRIEWLNEFH